MPTRENDNLMDDLDDFDSPDDQNEGGGRSMPDLVQLDLSEEAGKVLSDLQAELDEAIAARQRALADFRNYQRRATENERRALNEGAMRIIRSILPVLDNFDLALGQDTQQATAEQIIGGVRMVRDELIKALEAHGAKRIEPRRGEPFDPNQHQAMLYQQDDEIEPHHIVSVLQPGYALGEIALRPAKVAIAPEGDNPGNAESPDAPPGEGSGAEDSRFHEEEPGD